MDEFQEWTRAVTVELEGSPLGGKFQTDFVNGRARWLRGTDVAVAKLDNDGIHVNVHYHDGSTSWFLIASGPSEAASEILVKLLGL